MQWVGYINIVNHLYSRVDIYCHTIFVTCEWTIWFYLSPVMRHIELEPLISNTSSM